MTITTLTIDGMTCQGCVTAVKTALGQLGVQDSQIDLVTKQAVITHEDFISYQMLVAAVEEAGFDVEK